MEAATFPQPAGDIMIRPASAAPAYSMQTTTRLTSHQSPENTHHASNSIGIALDGSRASSSLSQYDGSSSNRSQQLQVVHPPPARPSSAQRLNREQRLQIITDLKRGTPGETRAAPRNSEEKLAARQRGQAFGEMFASREPVGSARERVGRNGIVTAEVKTNVIIHDEYSFLTSLSSFLSERFGRPESNIAITLQHSTCVLLGGSFEPAYIMTLTALPDLVSPTLNKRNAALLQRHMADELAVSSDRGVIRFVPIADSCLATAGVTVMAAVEAERAGGNAVGHPATQQPKPSNSSPWRTVWKQQQQQQHQYQSPADSRTSAASGPTGNGAGGSGPVGALVGAAGLFGRRKESKRDLKEQERRALLKGKAREAEKDLLDERPNGHSYDQYSRQHSIPENDDLEPESPREYDHRQRSKALLPNPFHRRKTSGSSGGHGGRLLRSAGSRDLAAERDQQDDFVEMQRMAKSKASIPRHESRSSVDEQAEHIQQTSKRRSILEKFGRP